VQAEEHVTLPVRERNQPTRVAAEDLAAIVRVGTFDSEVAGHATIDASDGVAELVAFEARHDQLADPGTLASWARGGAPGVRSGGPGRPRGAPRDGAVLRLQRLPRSPHHRLVDDAPRHRPGERQDEHEERQLVGALLVRLETAAGHPAFFRR
jgi:hypothetical protein